MTQTIKIIQHSVLSWNTNRNSLTNIYNNIDADIILINSHSLINNTNIKIFNYNTFTCNKTNELHSGIAIAIKKTLTYKLDDTYHTDFLDITIDTNQGPVTIGTTYIPPRTKYINYIDFNKFFRKQNPTYLLADTNASHPILGTRSTNSRGRHINTLITNNICTHIGPYFPTFISHRLATSPDIVLTNNNTFHNIHLQPGPLTPSDHIPIIATITANPIQIPITPRYQFHRANWQQYQTDMLNTNTHIDNDSTLEEIDEHLKQWTQTIQKATQNNIPKISYRTIPGIKPTPEIQSLETQHRTLIQDISTLGPTLEKYRTLRQLRTNIKTQYNNIKTEVWTHLINKLQIGRAHV